MESWQEAEVCLHCMKEEQSKIHQGHELQAWLDKHWKIHAFQAAAELLTKSSSGKLKSYIH